MTFTTSCCLLFFSQGYVTSDNQTGCGIDALLAEAGGLEVRGEGYIVRPGLNKIIKVIPEGSQMKNCSPLPQSESWREALSSFPLSPVVISC